MAASLGRPVLVFTSRSIVRRLMPLWSQLNFPLFARRVLALAVLRLCPSIRTVGRTAAFPLDRLTRAPVVRVWAVVTFTFVSTLRFHVR